MIEAGQNPQVTSRRLLVAALIVLAGVLYQASTASASSYWEQVGLGSRFTYSDPNCTKPADPINVIWEEGPNAGFFDITTARVAKVLRAHGWTYNEYNSPTFKDVRPFNRGDIGYQWIIRLRDGKCVRDEAQVTTGKPYFAERYHVRLFEILLPNGRRYVYGAAHRETKVSSSTCNTVKFWPMGGSDYGHVATSFDLGRNKLIADWQSSRRTRDWGNTQLMRQCNGQYTHSDGDVLYLSDSDFTPVMHSLNLPQNLTEPTISGTPKPGNVLSVTPGSWVPSPSGFTYQWCRVNLEIDDCAPISGATGTSWTPGAGDAGQIVGVTVTPTSGGESALSQVVEITNGPTSPSVTTLEAQEVTKTSARLTGMVSPNGYGTNYYFEYGKTTAYGSTYPAPPGWDIGGGGYAWNDISGLTAGTVYHYRVVASNAAGTSTGEDRAFMTTPTPPIVTTNPAEGTQTTINFRASVNPNGQDTYYYFEYGKGTDYGNAVPASPGGYAGSGTSALSVNSTATGLEPGTTYHYRIVGVNDSGTTYGEDRGVTTIGPFVEALPPGEVTQSKIVMRAHIENGGDPGSWYFEYGSTPSYGSKTEQGSIEVGAGAQYVVSAGAEGLEVGQTIHYRIVAKNPYYLTTTYGPDQVATTAWSNEASSGPASSLADWQEDISCPAAGNCISVGGYINSATANRTIAAERWNGTSWTPIMPAAPEGTSYLNGVSCPSTTNCLAVGYVVAANQSVRPLIMKWNGSAWSEVSAGSQIPAGYNNYLNDISCASATSCEAVGYSLSNSNALTKPLAMHWDGSAWTVRQSANPSLPFETNILESVSCASATVCKAVGRSAGEAVKTDPLIESLSDTEWVSEAPYTQNFTNPETEFWLQGVSCPTTSACLAVGHLRLDGETRAFTQRFTGSQWVGEPVNPEANQVTMLTDVSCSSATSCRAVGAGGLGLHWTGTDWGLQAPKPPADRAAGTLLTLSGVACPTARECHAVGSYTSTAGGQSRLTQGWSGAGAVPAAAWSITQSVTETSATLRGLINPAGVDANYYFEYGPTTSYGTKTPEAAAGSGNWGPSSSSWLDAKTPVTGLEPGKTYHYRVVATNGVATAYGADTTFTTKFSLAELPVTEPFNGGSSNISDFATKWAPLQWTSTRKGKNNANGYGPADTAANGAYFIPTVTDGGGGIATQATIATGPGVGGKVSLWLDLVNPSSEKRGYELLAQETAANTYTLTLKRWISGTEFVLGTKTGYSLPAGSSLALADKGTALSVWANTGSGLTKAFGATEGFFSGGAAGIEITGSTATRVTNFKVGTTAEKAADVDTALKAIPLADDLNRTESPLSLSGSWVAFPWTTATVKTGKAVSGTGWTPADGAIAGAYWQKAMASDTGTGDAVMATHNLNFLSPTPSYGGLWLNAPSPGSVRSGYQLRIVGVGGNSIEFQLVKWVSGTPSSLGVKTVSFPLGLTGVKFALLDKGGTVSVYSSPGQGQFPQFTQVLSAADSTYSYGYAGIEGAGATAATRDFRLGQLPLY